jgi:two-component sensor histidine kinase
MGTQPRRPQKAPALKGRAVSAEEAFIARLNTMASAQDILTQTVWARASLAYLVEESLKGSS